jgi:hypothetical protein
MHEFFNFKKKEKPSLDKDTTRRIEKTSIELGRKDLIKEDQPKEDNELSKEE